MNWMDKLERKIGRYAIPNLSRYFVLALVIGFFIQQVSENALTGLAFQAEGILHGQIWRLVTWIFIPATSFDFFGLLFLLCVLLWGQTLESLFGTFRMNLFLWGSVLFCDIGGLAVYGISRLALGVGVPILLTSYYILMTILLAIAICLPEAEVRLYFVLPIKMKWMLVFELIYLGYKVFSIFQGTIGVVGSKLGWAFGIMGTAQIVLPIIYMFLFFWMSKTHITRGHRKRQKEFRAQFSEPRPGSGISQHKCVICGRTEVSNPELQFRYCSKCTGNKEYCQDHLFTHTHM